MKTSALYFCWLAHGTEAWQSTWPSNQLKLGSSRLGPRLSADRFGPPGLEGQVPTILDVARPLMDAAKALERAGTTVVSFAGDERPIFDGGQSDHNFLLYDRIGLLSKDNERVLHTFFSAISGSTMNSSSL